MKRNTGKSIINIVKSERYEERIGTAEWMLDFIIVLTKEARLRASVIVLLFIFANIQNNK